MNRIVIQLGNSVDFDGRPYVSISLEKPRIQNSPAVPFLCTADDPVFQALSNAQLDASSVKVAGDRLFEALRTHPHIGEYLQTALQTAAGGRYPVLIEIATSAGPEALPWEALCSPNGDFLGLDERWSLARMVTPQAEASPVYRLTPPIRIAAVLSCLDISAAGELDALRNAIRAAGTQHTRLLVVASEEQLIIDLQAEMAAGTAPEVAQVEVMPTDLAGLQDLVSRFGPHILHFFCHGSRKGSPHIALALKGDWQTAPPRTSSLLAEAGDFKGFKHRTDNLPWLVVLNCCEGAGVGVEADSQSLALSLALEGIAPAVVGMREPVVSDTANLLTKTLYSKLLTELARRIDADGQSMQPVDWSHLVVAARDRLARTRQGLLLSQAAACTKEWTLPVIYVGPDEFNLQVLSSAPTHEMAPPMPPGAEIVTNETAARAARLEIEALQALLASLPPDQAGALKAEANARIAELSAQLGVDLADGGTQG
jgi:hypothetical protein